MRHISAVALLLAGVTTLFAQQTRTTWRDYLGGSDSSHYSALKQIDKSNVNKLQVAWSYDTSADPSYTFCPIVVDNVAYFAAKQGALVAVDAATGKEIWTHSFESPGGGGGFPGRGGISGQRGANYWESKDRSDRRILVSASGYLYAIDARTGKLVESFADGGRLDLKTGLDRTTRPLASRTPGRIFENIIILGSATGEGYLAPPGDIRAFDVVTGKLVWVFHTIPRPGEMGYDTWPKDAYKYMGGVDVWGEFSVDEKRGIVYLPTASAKYELYGGDRKGDNLFADCLLALDARTGKYLWHYQTVHHDLWDYDPDAAPQLVTVKHGGKSVDAVALASKNGFLYVFDRVSGKPLWPIEERPVPASDVPGEIASKTQPFPTVVPPFGRQGMTVKDLYTGFMKPEQIAWWKDRLSSAKTGFYTPPGLIDTISLPSVNGGALFFGSAADPTDGTVYVMSKDMPSILKLVEAGQSTAANNGGLIPERPRPAGGRGAAGGRGGPAGRGAPTPAQIGRSVYEQACEGCHGADLKGDRGPGIDAVISRLGADSTRKVITDGRGGMPSFSSIPEPSMDALIAFLTNPAAGVANPMAAAFARGMREPDYPADVDAPPSRYKTGYGNEGYVIKPPWSSITAYDLNTGKIKWQAPYGDVPQAGPSDKMRGNVFPKSGMVITAGGLVLFAGNDSKLYALDKETGKLIFAKDLPNGSLGVPAVYEVNGREFVLFAVSGGNGYPPGAYVPAGGITPPATSKSYIAFALPAAEGKP
ncbi:MAG TPA: PQQ-binding-like beta-propeller repeat protein [Candidatus Limnocylindrales bacterium]|nr:PQQ-binding-like beta-propeller repeat protein [Candidatus Limnocylindrales bacterium]